MQTDININNNNNEIYSFFSLHGLVSNYPWLLMSQWFGLSPALKDNFALY